MDFSCSIVTPDGKIFEGQIESLIAPGSQGAFGVLANHAPMVVSLAKGVVQLRELQGEKFFAIDAGILEVSRQHEVLLLSDSAKEAKNKEEAQASLKEFV